MSLLCKEFLIKIILVSFKCQNRNYIKSTLSIRKLVSKIRKCGTDSVLWVISTPPWGKEWAFHFSHIEQILIISIQSERRSLLIIEPSFLVLSHLNSSRGGGGRGENGLLTCVQYTISWIISIKGGLIRPLTFGDHPNHICHKAPEGAKFILEARFQQKAYK